MKDKHFFCTTTAPTRSGSVIQKQVDIITSYMKVIILKLLFLISLMDFGQQFIVLDLTSLLQVVEH